MHEAQVSSTTPKPGMLQPDGSSGWQSTDAYPSGNKQNDHLNATTWLLIFFVTSDPVIGIWRSHWMTGATCQNQSVNPEICFHTVGPWNWQFPALEVQVTHCVSVEIVAWHDLSWACWKVTVIHMFKKYSQYCNTDDGRNPVNQLIW